MPVPSFLDKQMGPLPVWGYLAAGTGGLLLLGLLGHGKAVPAPAPAVAAPATALLPPMGMAGGSSVYDANTGQVASAPQSGLFGNGFLGGLSTFIGGLANQPNTISLTDPSGASISLSNGVSTYGGGAGSPLTMPNPVLNPGQMWASPSGSIMSDVYLTNGQTYVSPNGYQFSGGQILNPGQVMSFYGNSGAGFNNVATLNPGETFSAEQPGYPYNAAPVVIYGQNPSGGSSQPIQCTVGSPGCYRSAVM